MTFSKCTLAHHNKSLAVQRMFIKLVHIESQLWPRVQTIGRRTADSERVTAVQRCVYHSLNYYSPAILIYFPYVYVLCFNVRQIVCCNICSLIRNDKERSNIVRALATCSVLSWPTVELCPLGRLRIFESESLDPFGRSEERVLPPFHPILNNVQKILNSSPRNPI